MEKIPRNINYKPISFALALLTELTLSATDGKGSLDKLSPELFVATLRKFKVASSVKPWPNRLASRKKQNISRILLVNVFITTDYLRSACVDLRWVAKR